VSSLAQDTSPAQVAEYYRLLRALTPAQRLRAMGAATRRMRMMAVAGIRLRAPSATDEQVRVELARLLYGTDVANRLAAVLGR
jgi:hypothetical protein